MVERILYDAPLCAESAIIFPRSSLRQVLSADGTGTIGCSFDSHCVLDPAARFECFLNVCKLAELVKSSYARFT